MTVAVLFARRDSIYKTMLGVDVWDADRDARNWPGGAPVVAHPPCRAWGRLRHFARPVEGEKDLALLAVRHVRRWGGVLEHPAGSTLWAAAGLPWPGEIDAYGGWTLAAPQYWWGHRAEKNTWFYIVGIAPAALPAIPLVIGEAAFVVQSRRRINCRPHIPKSEREATPPELARWLVETARRCGGGRGRWKGRSGISARTGTVPVSRSIVDIIPVETNAPSRTKSLGQAKISSCEPTTETLSLFGGLPRTGRTARKALSAPSSGTKARTYHPSLSDRLMQSLISAGLVRGTTPSWIRKQSLLPIRAFASLPLAGGGAVGLPADCLSSIGQDDEAAS